MSHLPPGSFFFSLGFVCFTALAPRSAHPPFANIEYGSVIRLCNRYSRDGGEGAAVEALLGADVGMPPHVRQVVAAPEVTAQNDGEMVTPIITPAGKPRSNAVCPHCDVELPHVPCKHKEYVPLRLAVSLPCSGC